MTQPFKQLTEEEISELTGRQFECTDGEKVWEALEAAYQEIDRLHEDCYSCGDIDRMDQGDIIHRKYCFVCDGQSKDARRELEAENAKLREALKKLHPDHKLECPIGYEKKDGSGTMSCECGYEMAKSALAAE